MGDELEAAGAAATAGLVAGALEGSEAREAATGPCANCGAELLGRYCSNCGQPARVHRSLWHLVEEALHGLVHFDTKMWRTLPKLAFAPGTLTRDYIEGRRARYVSPLALFLFCIFLMFFVFAFVRGPAVVVDGEGAGPAASAQSDLQEASAEIAAERARAQKAGDVEEAAALGAVQGALDSAGANAEGDEDFSVSELQREIDEAIAEGKFTIDTGDAARDERLTHAAENIEFTLYKVQQAAYKFAFLLIPISLPMIALLFLWKRGVTWFDHTVFALYSLSFMSLFYLVGSVALQALHGLEPLSGLITTAMVFVPPVHMFFHLGGTYKLGIFSALWRTIALLTICGIAFIAFLVLIVLIGVLG